MTDYQYATAIKEADGTLWDYYPVQPYEDEDPLDAAKRAAKQWNEEDGESDGQECVVVRRVAPVPAGEWEIDPTCESAGTGE